MPETTRNAQPEIDLLCYNGKPFIDLDLNLNEIAGEELPTGLVLLDSTEQQREQAVEAVINGFCFDPEQKASFTWRRL